eukprot:8885261-Pyramimonas_sp.AAC.1
MALRPLWSELSCAALAQAATGGAAWSSSGSLASHLLRRKLRLRLLPCPLPRCTALTWLLHLMS